MRSLYASEFMKFHMEREANVKHCASRKEIESYYV